jgi:hypothetical protein
MKSCRDLKMNFEELSPKGDELTVVVFDPLGLSFP